jgi:trk system potassium uptake protein TrkH
MPRSWRRLSPPQLFALSILGLILLGTLLLVMPAASGTDQRISFVDALFTATSAVCVTGLIVRDTPVDFSTLGQVIILLLIQLGGLGYMTVSTLLAVALGRSITLQERLTLQESLNAQDLEGLVRFAGTVFKLTLAFELTGAAILAARWWSELGTRALWYGWFHSVSAFNNAGFSLWSDNLVRWRADLAVNAVITTLIICGGLGFLVLSELSPRRARTIKVSLHTKLVLTATTALLVGGTIAFLTLEWSNPRIFGGGLPFSERLLVAWFHSVTARTAGFNTIDIGGMTEAGLFIMMALMFIGASPGGTGGGVKTTTFSITVAALWATVRGDQETTIFKRRLPSDVVAKAFFVSLIAFLGLNVVAGVVLVSQNRGLLPTLFETTSAFGTVGLSMGERGSVLSLAGSFTPFGKLLIAGMMFMGRVGPLTLALALARRTIVKGKLRYPEGKVLIG